MNPENSTNSKPVRFKVIVEIPLRTYSESNMSEHYFVKAKRKKVQHELVQSYLWLHKIPILQPNQTCSLTFCRIAPRKLDNDNLQASFKKIRDSTCSYLRPGLKPGRADSEDIFSFTYSQEKGDVNDYRIRIEISLHEKDQKDTTSIA